MAFNSKPSGMNIVWASAGDILDPGDTKYQTGWGVEIPPRQWENYSQNKQDAFMAHANQLGVVDWDAETEYQINKSYVQGTANGTVYRCKLTHTNQDPELDVTNTYWDIAFASSGDFYTKTETDGLYLAKAQNLADLTNTATARTNLSVYSQAQTYTKTEVDAKTTVASTAQAQAFASNTTLISPLRLKESFQGGNNLISGNGYQKLPNGLLIQWGGVVNVPSGGSVTVSLPTAFASTPFRVTVSNQRISNLSAANAIGFEFVGLSQIKIYGFTTDAQPQTVEYIAIGV